MNKRLIGKEGELLACKYIVSKGYKILKLNWYCYAGEIDIVALNSSNILTFVEVKYVRNLNFCNPFDLFTQKKRKNLLRTFNTYFLKNNISSVTWCFDLICISKEISRYKINHYKNVLLTQ